MTPFEVAGFMGRFVSYWATGCWRAPWFCALAYEMEMLGFPQWAVVRRLLDAALGEGHCAAMWWEEMGDGD